MLQFISSGARCRALSLLKLFALLLAAAILAGDVAASTIDFSVGAKEVIYSKKTRTSKKLNTWPDGNMGVVNNGNGTYDFYGANGTSPVRTSGTLTNPGGAKKSVNITGLPSKTFNYVSGGPIFQDPDTGTRMMLYHAEKHGKSAKDYYSVLGLAVCLSSDGTTFTDLGTIIEPNIQPNQMTHSIDIGGGSFAVKDGYLNVYYRDYLGDGTSAELAVARASVSDVINNAFARQGTTFNKYYNGAWTEPGRGGRSSALEVGNPWNAWYSVSYNDYANQFMMVSAQPSATMTDLYMATSGDGISWSPRQGLAVDAGEQFYPTIVGTGADASRSGQSFYVYYTDSAKGSWNRWNDAALVRRQVTINSIGTPPVIPDDEPPVEEPPTPSDWVRVGNFQDDFQIGTPGDGWTFAWNPSRQSNNPAAFQSLKWSATEQVYNTTGGATVAPVTTKKKKKSTTTTHADDYLHLTGSGVGHPGQPGYMPILGYTIQEDDGAGLYQIAESLIAKMDGTTSSGEDGLQMLVYVNNALVGSTPVVSTNGSPLSFDRELGELAVGDTVWVMVSALGNQNYDSFKSFDFSIERAVPLQMMSMMAMGGGSLAMSAVPEPGTVGLLLIAALFGCMWRRPSRDGWAI